MLVPNPFLGSGRFNRPSRPGHPRQAGVRSVGSASGGWRPWSRGASVASLGQGPILAPSALDGVLGKISVLPFSRLSAGAFPGLVRQARAAASAALRGSAGSPGASGRWVFFGQGPILHPRPLTECLAIFRFLFLKAKERQNHSNHRKIVMFRICRAKWFQIMQVGTAKCPMRGCLNFL